MTTEAGKQVPPVPDTFPLLREDLGKGDINKLASHPWSRWFLSVREKINAINEALVNLGVLSDTGASGIPVLDGGTWTTVPVNGFLLEVGVLNELVLDNSDPQNPVISVSPTFISSSQVSAHWVPVPLTATSPGNVGDISMDADYFYTCEGVNSWKRTARTSW